MPTERILVAVKTYPTLSKKYGETVCTAGVRANGSWVRMYPVPFRRLEEEEQYKKFDWLKCRLERNKADPRPESYRPLDFDELRPVGHIDTANDWDVRRQLLLKKAKVYTRLDEIIADAKANRISLAVFRPTSILDFTWEEESREWDIAKLLKIKEQTRQLELFDDNSWRNTFQFIRKLPYSFSYKFEDCTGKTSELQILDWEVGALYWNCLRKSEGDERQALAKVRQRYFDYFLKKDVHFFLGTTLQFHFIAPNPWLIIGVFPIPHEPPSLFKDVND